MTVLLLWIIALAVMAAVIFGMAPLQKMNHKFNHAEDTVYNAFSRTGWSAAVIWIVIACVHGYGGENGPKYTS